MLFDGHVEVVTQDAGGVLHTVGGDSLPNFSVNAHEYPAPLAAAGVVGFVNNGSLPDAARPRAVRPGRLPRMRATPRPGTRPATGPLSGARPPRPPANSPPSQASPLAPARPPRPRPGRSRIRRSRAWSRRRGPAQRLRRRRTPTSTARPRREARPRRPGRARGQAAPAGTSARAARARVAPGDAAIPGLAASARRATRAPPTAGTIPRRAHPVSETRLQQAFISQIAPGAIAAQHRYGVPAAVTIAQAIDESGWGQSELAAHDHNLFGIKGTGPAGSVPLPTQEYVNGQPVSTSASFRVYHNVAESIDDHGRLLARSGYYQQAMADRQHPDKFAAALTGVYATDPNYGANLISLMRRYDLYRYQAPDHGQPGSRTGRGRAGQRDHPRCTRRRARPARPSRPASPPSASPRPTRTASPRPTRTASPQPTRTASPQPTRTASPQPTRTASPKPTQTQSPQPTPTGSPGPSPTSRPEPTGTASPQPARTATPGASTAQSARPAASPQPTSGRAARAPPQRTARLRTRRPGRRDRDPARRPPRRPHPRNRRSRE